MSEPITVQYRVDVPEDGPGLAEVARQVADEQSLGGYEWRFDRDFDADRYRARWRNTDPATGTVEVEFPVENVAPELPHLLNYVAGDVFGSSAVDRIEVTDVELPRSLVEAFPGPQFGIEGIRDRAGVSERRPLLGMIVKPSLGLEPGTVADLTETAIRADVDVVKEDEKLVDPSYCPFEERLDAVVEVLDRVTAETGNDVLYVLNVTGRVDAFAEYVADRGLDDDLVERFVLLVTPVTLGFGSLARLARDDRLDLPVYAHRTGHAAVTRAGHGVRMRVFERLFRLAGADCSHCGTVTGSHERDREEVVPNRAALVDDAGPWADVPPTLPVVSGGVTPANVAENMRGVGYDEPVMDLLFVVGSGIYAHAGGDLDGIADGIAANRQAIEAAREGVPVATVRTTTDSRFPEMTAWLREERDRRRG